MSTVDDRLADDLERQLAGYFAWLDTELGPVGAPTVERPHGLEGEPEEERPTRRWWLAAAAVVLALVAGLALVVGRNAAEEQVPASPTGDLRDVSGWFELDLTDVEVIETYTSLAATTPAGAEAYYVWADLDGDPIRSLSAYFPAGDVPLDLDDDIDPPAAIPDPPDGEAWVVDDPATGADVLRVQWTRADGSVVLTAGTGIDAVTLADWTFAVGAESTIPPSPPDPALELLLDASQVEPSLQYQENWVVDGVDVSAWVSRSAPAVWFGLGYPSVERVSVADRDGFRFGGGGEDQPALVTFPLRNGYWGTITMPADRADELIDHVVVVDDSFPTPDEVTSNSVTLPAVGSVELAAEWQRVVSDELTSIDPDLDVDLTSASETYPVGAVALVPIDTGGRLVVDLRIWPTGRYDDPDAWFDAVGVPKFGTAFPEGAVFVDTDGPRPRVGVVTELGVVELTVELPTGDAPVPAWAEFDDPGVLDDLVGIARRLTVDVPEVLAATGVDRDAGTVCADDACDDGQVLARIEIPAIDVDAEVLTSPRYDLLDEGRGLTPGNVPIASPGVVRIWGHRTTYGAPFLDLDQLEPGDEVVLTSPAERFVYVVRSVDVVGPDAPVGASLDPTLVLSTPHPKYASRQELRVTAEFCSTCLPKSLEPAAAPPP